jgi:aminomethyltransferase
MIVLNAGCKDKDWAWLVDQVKGETDVTLTDESDETALIAVQGPDAVALVAALDPDADLAEIKRFHFASVTLLGIPCVVSRTGYTGEDGFEIFCPWADAPHLWATLSHSGATPAGLGARDVLRLEAAYPLYGHELDSEHGPLESGVAWAVKTKKGEFIGRDTVVAGRASGPLRQLVGLRMDERAIPREEFPVYAADGTTPIGAVTSGTFSPTVKAGIAMARLDVASAAPGTPVQIDIRGRRAGAKVVPLPFYRNGV